MKNVEENIIPIEAWRHETCEKQTNHAQSLQRQGGLHTYHVGALRGPVRMQSVASGLRHGRGSLRNIDRAHRTRDKLGQVNGQDINSMGATVGSHPPI